VQVPHQEKEKPLSNFKSVLTLPVANGFSIQKKVLNTLPT